MVSDSLGGTDPDTVTVTVNAVLTVSAVASPSSIDSGKTSSLTATASGGSDGYTYQWYSGSCPASGSAISSANPYTTPALTTTTTYCVVVTDSLGGTASASVTVTVNGAMTVSASASPSTIDSGKTSTITATASGGSGGYTYAFYSGAELSGSPLQSSSSDS